MRYAYTTEVVQRRSDTRKLMIKNNSLYNTYPVLYSDHKFRLSIVL